MSIKYPLSSPSKELYAHWYELYEKIGDIPTKQQFSPRGLRGGTLAHVLMLEYNAQNVPFVRISGTRIDDYFGQNMTGVNALAVPNAISHGQLRRFYARMQAGVYYGAIMRRLRTDHGQTLTVRSYYLPIKDDTGLVKFLLGSMLVEGYGPADVGGPMAFSPQGLGISRIHSMDLYDVLNPDVCVCDMLTLMDENNETEDWTKVANIA